MTATHEHGPLERILDALTAFFGATAAACAVRNGQEPAARDLRALGIPPEEFHTIARF